MLDHFLKILKRNFKINDNTRVLLAVSGGLDSMVLADLFHKSGANCGVAHVNFLLRGEASNADQNLVEKAAKKYSMPFYLHSEDAGSRSKEWKVSTQMAARKIRYIFFDQVLNNEAYQFIATAHHADDNFETAILNLLRGSGHQGLMGIPQINNSIIRPLLYFNRQEIHDYAKDNGIEWREDASNDETKYDRNKIRHEIIPKIRELNPAYLKTFEDTCDKLQMMDLLLNEALSRAEGEWIFKEENCVKIDAGYFLENPSELALLWEYLKAFEFNFDQFRSIVKSLNAESGKRFENESYLLEKDRQYFYLSKIRKQSIEEYTIEESTKNVNLGQFDISFESGNGNQEINSNPKEAFLDADKLDYPLTIRNWCEGDSFQPLGMKGKKKLSDYMIDEKIPLNLKRQQKVLVSGEHIVWVIGRRIDHRYRITESTKKSLHLKIS